MRRLKLGDSRRSVARWGYYAKTMAFLLTSLATKFWKIW